MSYNYQIAKDLLSESEKNRIVAIYLNCEPTSVNWAKATTEFGAKSIDSMKVSTRSIMKKLEAAGCKEGVEASTTPAKTPMNKKRKATEDEDTPTPAPKKRGRPSKKAAKPVVESDAEDEAEEEDVPKAKREPKAEDDVEAGDEN